MAASKSAIETLKLYLSKIKDALEAGDATEHTHRPALKDLIESLDAGITAVNEPKRVSCGAPDYAVKRRNLSIGYIEAKDVGKSLDEAEDSDQLERYKKSLHNLILTDYLEFRWYVDGELRGTARLARQRKDKLVSDRDGVEETAEILNDFLSHNPEPIADPQKLSEQLARLAHIIRDTIVGAFEKENASQDLRDLRDAFSEVLIPDLNRPEKLAEFADMYAQTIVYGLFAARCNHQGPGPFQRLGAAREIPKTNPFLKKLFESITGSSLDDEPYVDFVEDLVAILASTDMERVLENFGKRTRQEDPIVHFYETFLAAYDPKTRERRGVYYTPEPVVQYIVKSVDYILKSRFGLEGGLAPHCRCGGVRQGGGLPGRAGPPGQKQAAPDGGGGEAQGSDPGPGLRNRDISLCRNGLYPGRVHEAGRRRAVVRLRPGSPAAQAVRIRAAHGSLCCGPLQAGDAPGRV